MFGPHLALDCYGCNKKKLSDMDFVYKFLDNLPKNIGMHKIAPPYTFTYYGKKPEDWGVSGIVLIAESHISVHTFPEKVYATFDIFSCKEFDVERTVNYILAEFEVEKHEANLLFRGKEFSRNVEMVVRAFPHKKSESSV